MTKIGQAFSNNAICVQMKRNYKVLGITFCIITY